MAIKAAYFCSAKREVSYKVRDFPKVDMFFLVRFSGELYLFACAVCDLSAIKLSIEKRLSFWAYQVIGGGEVVRGQIHNGRNTYQKAIPGEYWDECVATLQGR